MRARTKVLVNDIDPILFEQLVEIYPMGEYGERDGSRWFQLYIDEMNLELVWFL